MIPTIRSIDLASRDGLRRIFIASAPTNAVRTGLRLGNCEMLGAFDCIPPSNKPGWICRVWTRTNPAFRHLAILVDNEAASHRVVEIPRVPWGNWAKGSAPGEFTSETRFWTLQGGDFPGRNLQSHQDALRYALSDSAPNAGDGPSGGADRPERGRKPASRFGSRGKGRSWWSRLRGWFL